MIDPNKLQVTLSAISAAGDQDVRVGDLQRGRIYNIVVTNSELRPVIKGSWPLNCVVQNLGTQNVYLVFESRSIAESLTSALVLPPSYQWTPFGIFPLAANAVGAGAIDVSDRVGRLLGIVASITAPVDVSDRAARLLGVINSITNPIDVSDRAARLLGVINSITNPIDISDRVGRLLGIVASITAPIDVSDRAGRLLGIIASITATVITDPTDRVARILGHVLVDEGRAATLHITGTAAVNTALTITLPASAGNFHYITSIEWHKLYSVVGIAAGAGIIITSTNLPGAAAWTTEQLALAAGSVTKVIDYKPTTPLKSSVVNTATTIVAPLQLQTIWRGNISYFVAP